MVVLQSPAFGQDLCFLKRVENLPIEQLITQLAIERLHVAIFPRAAQLDEERLN